MKTGDKTKFGVVKNVIFTATVMHNGWEMDNEAWLVEMEDGKKLLLNTNHGGVYELAIADLREKIAETEKSAESLRQLAAMFTAQSGGRDMKSGYKDILNALVEMQQSNIYAARKQTLFYAKQAIFALEQKLLLSEPKKAECAWVPDVDDCRAFETTCGNAFVLNDGDPRTNGVSFCPYCGGKLVMPNVKLSSAAFALSGGMTG